MFQQLQPSRHDTQLMRVREAWQHDSRPPEVRRAAEVVGSLAGRIGQVYPEAGVQYDANSGLLSTVLSCGPAQWGDRSCALLEWLAQSVRNVSIPVCSRLGNVAPGGEYDGNTIRPRVVGVDPRAGVRTTTMGCPFQWGCTRTALEQCSPHQRSRH